jgi:hypothetical protein
LKKNRVKPEKNLAKLKKPSKNGAKPKIPHQTDFYPKKPNQIKIRWFEPVSVFKKKN